MMKKQILTVLTPFLMVSTAMAQPKDAPKAYTISLGAKNEGAKQYDFEVVRSSAYVHSRAGAVAMGMFYTPETAQQFMELARARNFATAEVQELDLAASPSVSIIQVITQTAGEPIEWASLEAVLKEGEQLWIFPNENQVRIVIGTFDDLGLARARAAEIEAAGFEGAFARKVKSILLTPASDFEKNDTRPKDLTKKGRVKPKPKPNLQSAPKPAPTPVVTSKRNSAVEIQKILKSMGHYGGAIDGKLGAASNAGFEAAVQGSRRLKNYAALAENQNGFGDWTDARLLMVMSRDLNSSNQIAEIAPDLLLNLPTEPLAPEIQAQMENWNNATWTRLDGIAKQAKLADAQLTPLKLVYLKTLNHLETEFSKNALLSPTQVSGLAVWTLKTLVGDDLDSL